MLNINGLKKSFDQPGGGRMPVLDIPHYAIAAAEQAVLIGRSGGGKTTLLHVIAGLTTADAGSVRVGDIELTELSEAGRDRYRAAMLGYVFQTFNLLPGFTALENVRLGMSFASGRHDIGRARELLNRVGLSDRENHRPAQLSVGQQQRVAIARALSSKPKLLLADEPTANVDPASQQQVIDLIRQTCQDEEVALLLVTHSMEVANQFDRVENLADINVAFAAATGASQS
ncbi:Lipoprotein-releasing system ATP-binding protein LolD [Roseimaritima multifibrata]|uniref:Lipoprotein-releasing system ATP-binding protein LolD n=1 Tax=Roseimaritima multifibrata TaxID=1930274 RepID=A0A517MAT9_9BACT|nr:ABC transporter ATP-binding protein [Roseimaritima multifibrata]QDS91907.1 Lipoprotein-releasing system ATP-binding protein LolD [Roseimaritima multifibrata]